MSRAKWKIINFTDKIVQARSNIITPNLFNKIIKIHNGKEFKTLLINSEHIGHKFGEFINTKLVAKFKTSVK